MLREDPSSLSSSPLWSDWDIPPQPRAQSRDLFIHASPPAPVQICEVVDGGEDAQLACFLQGLALALAADAAILSRHDRQLAVSLTEGAPNWLRSNPDWLIAAALPPSDRLGGDQGGWRELSINNQWLQVLRLPIRAMTGRGTFAVDLVFPLAGAQARRAAEAKLTSLMPMIASFFTLWQRSQARERSSRGLHQALDSLEIGIVAVDQNLQILFSNKAAEAALQDADQIRRSGAGFCAAGLADALSLQVALNHAIADSGKSNEPLEKRKTPIVALRSARSERSLLLSVIPADEVAIEEGDVAAIVCMLDPHLDTSYQLQPVCRLYGLSPVEGRLVCEIAAGASLQEAAATLRIKEQTARSYLKQIFLKTDTKRQADLVRVMLCSLLRIRRGLTPVCLPTSDAGTLTSGSPSPHPGGCLRPIRG